MKLVSLIRRELRFPFTVNSGHRCELHPIEAARIRKGKPPGPHFHGAMDIGVSFERAYLINKMASDFDMGLGICQHGTVDKRFFHLDNQGPRIWTYPGNR